MSTRCVALDYLVCAKDKTKRKTTSIGQIVKSFLKIGKNKNDANYSFGNIVL